MEITAEKMKALADEKGSIAFEVVLNRIRIAAENGKIEIFLSPRESISELSISELSRLGFGVSFFRPAFQKEKVWHIDWSY